MSAGSLKPPAERRALVLGGSGAVGAEVVRRLSGAGVPTAFTFHTGAERAESLAVETGAEGHQVDLRDLGALRALLADLEGVDVLVHCAAVTRAGPLAEAKDADWDDVVAVNVRAPYAACQALAPAWAESGADVVLVGALDRGQALPIPVAFATTQGALGALAMSLAKELGPATRVNLVAAGVLDAGLSRDLSGKVLADFEQFSALARRGTPGEVSEVIAWLALENTYVSGETVAVNGGI